ncbi:MAG: family 43 glycosylhydrolase [Bacteroidota bacterium]|nr:family 43 glycosylhydrolase [Bacteroidota bacterium]
MKKLVFLIAVSLLFACNQADKSKRDFGTAQGDLGNGYFLNPILGGDYPDPTIMRDGKDYYMTHSSFDYVPGLVVFHSTDLVNWQPISYALKRYLGSVWAPDICKHEDRYYIYFTVAHPSGRMNFVTYADSPYGPWSDPIDLKVGNIDPGHAVGEDGSRWIFLSGGQRARLSDDGLSIVPGSLEKVYEGWIYPSDWVTEGMCLEGPKIRKIGEYFYYLNAEGGTAGPPTSHMVVAARSKSINGPWENSPYNPIVRTWQASERWWSKGHGSIIDSPKGDWWIVYHAYENGFTSLGRQTLLEPIKWTSDGWFVAPSGTAIERPLKKPLSSGEKIDRRSRLGEFRVGLDWKFYKDFDTSRFEANQGELTLQAQGDSPGNSSPIMCVAGEHAYEIEVEIEKDEHTTAGLVLYYNSDFYAGIGFDQQRTLRFRQGILRTASRHEGGNHLWLRLRNDHQVLTGAYSYDGINWIKETWGMEISGYNHNTLYEFQSMLPALYAAGEGKVKFRNFKYTSL